MNRFISFSLIIKEIDLNRDLNRWFESFDLNQIHPATDK